VKVAWTDLHAIRETKSLFLLYAGPNIAIVPKRFFTNDAQVNIWKRLAAMGIAPGTIKAGGFGNILC
jgi:hypothetical protein